AKDIAFSLKSNAMGFMRDMGIGPDGAPLQRATHDKEAEEVSIDTILSSARREAVKKMMSPPAAAPAPAPAPATRAAAMPTSTDAEYKDTEAAEQYAAEEVEGGEVEEEQLPPGWMKLYDESSGYYYYYNEETGESLWEPPTGEY
ncbi:PIN1, partial [Symbiodinium sp. KB8]